MMLLIAMRLGDEGNGLLLMDLRLSFCHFSNSLLVLRHVCSWQAPMSCMIKSIHFHQTQYCNFLFFLNLLVPMISCISHSDSLSMMSGGGS